MDLAEADVVKQGLPLKKISEECLMHKNTADINMRLNKALTVPHENLGSMNSKELRWTKYWAREIPLW